MDNYYMFVRNSDDSIEQIFHWGDNRTIPQDYPILEGCRLQKISKEFYCYIQELWIKYSFTLVDINTNDFNQAFIKKLRGK